MDISENRTEIPLSDAELSSWESHFTVWEAEMPGEALRPLHRLACAGQSRSRDWGGGAVTPGIVFGLLRHKALYNSHKTQSSAKLWRSPFPRGELDALLPLTGNLASLNRSSLRSHSNKAGSRSVQDEPKKNS